MRIVAHMGGDGRVLQEVDLVTKSKQGIGEELLLGDMVDGHETLVVMLASCDPGPVTTPGACLTTGILGPQDGRLAGVQEII